jgi:hypothetical protein
MSWGRGELSEGFCQGRQYHSKLRAAAALAAIALSAAAIRAPFNSNVGVDEAFYLVIGRQRLQGSPPYAGSFDVKPPLLFALMAAAEWLIPLWRNASQADALTLLLQTYLSI